MSILNELLLADSWEAFYSYKQKNTGEEHLKELRAFIDQEDYRSVVESMLLSKPFTPPEKILISKKGSNKKRTVYSYNAEENMVLKLLTHLMIRKYDHLFSDNLYSFRAGRGVKDAIWHMTHGKHVKESYTYKLDISNYFNSVDLSLLLPMLSNILKDDPLLLSFLVNLLTNPLVLDKGKLIEEKDKGIMAGTPISVFLANLYLKDLDAFFFEKEIPYARYSDDILVMAKDEASILDHQKIILDTLKKKHLLVNESKECMTKPGEAFTFLGVSCKNGTIDVAPISVNKLKAKIRRKTRALKRRKERRHLDGTYAAGQLIKTFNKKLFDNPMDHELTWTRWYFPLITRPNSLAEIDAYMQDSIRFLASGTRSKSRYHFRYEDMKTLGYVSLVHEYYKFKEEKKKEKEN